jgi:CRISPR-associated Csx11 family protein
MPDLRGKLEGSREAILLGEFGGLLHMFGKASKDFLQANSLEGGAKDAHQEQRLFGSLWQQLGDASLTSRFVFGTEKLTTDFTDFVGKYKGDQPDSHLLRLFNACHRMTSADEKGVVRRKQSVNSIWITAPFGRKVQKVLIDQIDEIRDHMASSLVQELEGYLRTELSIQEFRSRLIRTLRLRMSQTLGETREPANDVTLWAQSSGVASLYKSTLAALAMGIEPCAAKNGKPDYDSLKWRLLGIGWNGAAFSERGRKPADIIERQNILGRIREELIAQLELQAPIGNLFYADLNGVFFTFPGIDKDSSSDLIREIGPGLINIVRQESSNELWPFLMLSRPRRTLTVIAQQISARDRVAAAPCTAAALILEDDGSEVLVAPGPTLKSDVGQDVCPACRVRSKRPADEICNVCRDRRSGRQTEWLQHIDGETIWVDEIADNGNRLALLTLRFDLAPWLDGAQLATILTQTPDDRAKGPRFRTSTNRLNEVISKGQLDLADIVSVANWAVANRTRTECKAALESFMEDGAISDVPGFFRELDDSQGIVSSDALLSSFFTQNPSPGRLTRILEASEDFIKALNQSLRANVFASHPQRIGFTTSVPVAGVRTGRTYRLMVAGLRGGPLVVLARSKQEFLTADNLDKFGGTDSVKLALKKNGVQEWRDEDSGELVNGSTVTDGGSLESGYLPFTALSRSPVFSQFLLPANRLPDVLRILLDLEAEHFGSVRGKLALHVGVLVAKRKFPLYALLEAGRQIVNHPSLNREALRTPWFNTDGVSDFYSLYPTSAPGSHGHEYSKLDRIEQGRRYWLTPGYFDFDYLGGTADTQRLRYAGHAPERPSIGYGWLHPRPMPLFRLSDLLEIWRLLGAIGTTQRHEIAAALASRLEEWRGSEATAVPIYARFAHAVLQDAFTDRLWNALSGEEKALLQNSALDGLLLETIEFFDHVVKGEATT